MSKRSYGAAASGVVFVAAALFCSPSASSAPGPQDPGAGQSNVRGVRFAIDPPGAQLAIDGRVVSWFGKTLPLAVGSHSILAEAAGSRCCKPMSTTISVAPARGGGLQTI